MELGLGISCLGLWVLVVGCCCIRYFDKTTFLMGSKLIRNVRLSGFNERIPLSTKRHLRLSTATALKK